MAQKDKKRVNTKSSVEDMTMSPNERILKNITDLYEKGPNATADGPASKGLKQVCEDPLVNSPCHSPRKRVTCMVIGNHSAGKSSLLNWYIGETIQHTGVAIETRGFSFLTSGRKRETLKGDATLAYFSHLSDITQFEGINANLFSEVSTSKEKNFSCVDFIDTPGLVDGDMQYPFDVSSCIVWLADYVDLILVFFDPIGQALCKRTMDVIRRLNDTGHAEKMQYYMSKADQVDTELDRQRVLTQITMNLHPHIKNSHAFKLPTIYLPKPDGEDPNIPNAIQELCQDIDTAIRLTVQKNLTTLKTDCDRIITRMDQRTAQDKIARSKNQRSRLNGVFLTLMSMVVLVALLFVLLCQVHDNEMVRSVMDSVASVSPEVKEYTVQVKSIMQAMHIADVNKLYYVLGGLTLLFLAFRVVIRMVWKVIPVLTKKEKLRIEEYKKYVKGMAKIRDQLYKDYFEQLRNSE
mmetsp:Transcript_11338/g.21478  ORF Transcript_11338/g.21478 Transcript_11338/m.21478 type:complete len:464 (+) Transcript_11338:74-1465(+)|eukprot:CAMPEP_0114235810 /NCGR_PEP_ID=MMETSP0058-20121206/6456_1 /TAXON_ID=36894 /ORGANISM="Pyramimonas parkeae, CCMP726" /LENGTH=463 /DNA_ID=CAMNT_0001347611 /DNA_START=42 /DNA_END=1433 /DNA_ORIENTATION=-